LAKRKILSVGQCAADHATLARFFTTQYKADLVPAQTTDEALERLRQETFDLVLVNRLLDADGSPGLDLIRAMQAEAALRPVPVMLVSNYEEAQAQAVTAGARPGFGKAGLTDPATRERLRPFLGEG